MKDKFCIQNDVEDPKLFDEVINNEGQEDVISFVPIFSLTIE